MNDIQLFGVIIVGFTSYSVLLHTFYSYFLGHPFFSTPPSGLMAHSTVLIMTYPEIICAVRQAANLPGLVSHLYHLPQHPAYYLVQGPQNIVGDG